MTQTDAPRLPLLDPAVWPDEARAAMARWDPPFNIHRILAHNPALVASWIPFGEHVLFRSTFPPRERELAVLRVAWNSRCGYEWGQHVRVAAMVGLTPDEIARVPAGAEAPGWSEPEAAVIAAVDDMTGGFTIGEAAWKRLAACYRPEQLLDLAFLVGEFMLVALVLNGFRVPPDAGLAPLPLSPDRAEDGGGESGSPDNAPA